MCFQFENANDKFYVDNEVTWVTEFLDRYRIFQQYCSIYLINFALNSMNAIAFF